MILFLVPIEIQEVTSEDRPLIFNEELLNRSIKNFSEEIHNFDLLHCSVCKEAWFQKMPTTPIIDYECSRCKKFAESNSVNLYSVSNNMDPGAIPSFLPTLTRIEEQLISMAHPSMKIFRVKGSSQLGFSGNVINIPQDVGEFTKRLPRRLNEIDILCVKRPGNDESINCNEFKVSGLKILKWLEHLKENSPPYRSIEIDNDALAELPIESESIYSKLTSIQHNSPFDCLDDVPEVGPDIGDERDCQIIERIQRILLTDNLSNLPSKLK